MNICRSLSILTIHNYFQIYSQVFLTRSWKIHLMVVMKIRVIKKNLAVPRFEPCTIYFVIQCPFTQRHKAIHVISF